MQACKEIKETQRIRAAGKSGHELVHVVVAGDRRPSTSRQPLPADPRATDHYAPFNEPSVRTPRRMSGVRDSGEGMGADSSTGQENRTGNLGEL